MQLNRNSAHGCCARHVTLLHFRYVFSGHPIGPSRPMSKTDSSATCNYTSNSDPKFNRNFSLPQETFSRRTGARCQYKILQKPEDRLGRLADYSTSNCSEDSDKAGLFHSDWFKTFIMLNRRTRPVPAVAHLPFNSPSSCHIVRPSFKPAHSLEQVIDTSRMSR
jgi:hypothetical protein